VQELLRPDGPTRPEALSRCRRFLGAKWRGFGPGRLLLPADRRADLVAALAWVAAVQEVRRADDSVGGTAALADVLAEIERGAARTTLAVALQPVVHAYGISLVQLRGPLSEIDRVAAVRSFETRTMLAKHARRLGAPLGRLLLSVLGENGEKEELLADALAVGLCRIGWLRDLRADLARGRLFVAVEDLLECRLDILSLQEALASGVDERAHELVRLQIAEARAELAKGWPLCELLGPWHGRRLAFVLRWHAATLSAIEARGHRIPAGPLPAGWLRALACGVASARGTAAPFALQSPA